jgi:hypothetical protein
MEIPRIWELYPDLARAVKDEHEEVGLVATGHDIDHDLEVGQLAYMVVLPEDREMAVLAGVGGLLHSKDRILELRLGLAGTTISEVPAEDVRRSAAQMISQYTDITGENADRVVEAVVHHGSKPNKNNDNLVTVGVVDADRLANMGATLPTRSGQHNHGVRVLNPVTMECDFSDRSLREKYNNPDSVLYDIANAISWYRNPNGPYALRLPRSLEIGGVRAERLERYIREIKEDREFVGLYPYPEVLK